MIATLDPFVGLAHMLDHPFLRSAFLAGTCIALAAGLVGYVVVLRGQVFTGDALSHVAFTGALAALAFGIDLRAGLYGACIVFAVLMAALGRRASADDTVIGSVFAWVLGLGALFLSIFTTSQSGTGAVGSNAGVNVLFGSILGLSSSQAVGDAVVALGVVAAFVVIGRPLIFASLDESVAVGPGRSGPGPRATPSSSCWASPPAWPPRRSGPCCCSAWWPLPAGASQRLTSRPFVAVWLSAAIAVGSVWIGLTVAYLAPRVPPSFGIVAVATVTYLVSIAATSDVWRNRRHRSRMLRVPATTAATELQGDLRGA